MKMNKRGDSIIGSFIVAFATTIAIVLILMGFIFLSGVIKGVSDAKGGVAVYDEKGVEIDNVFDYMDDYGNLTKIRFLLAEDKSLDESFEEVEYEK